MAEQNNNQGKDVGRSHQALTQSAPVDMIAMAREATLRDQAAMYAGATKAVAPAKVNLYLGVGESRADGYHDVTTVLQALMLHDVLYVRVKDLDPVVVEYERSLAEEKGQEYRTDVPQVRVICVGSEGVEAPQLPSEQNLACKAVMALAEATGKGQNQAIDIRIEKHIPMEAGLGGGSSDAAAAMLAVADAWGIDAGDPVLTQVAAGLGADVAFFLTGGCAQLDGVGEVLQRKLPARKSNVVLVKPEGGLSTAQVYQEFDAAPDLPSAEVQEALAAAGCGAEVPLFNGLASTAERLMPELARVREWAAEQEGVTDVMLCGSGSASFLVCSSFEDACRVSAAAMAQGWWARTTSFSSLRAAVVPKQ
ncbi:MAG: 4-(cytidine 5'-diphospho)-2-C-methyl-D-erythritol kinase [Coriobacteriia bacterium]|nr:4-(cytidine 5'-diphospho)-2-C-methyl-D-erythritol kinase [Coriobacteriia bacterium]